MRILVHEYVGHPFAFELSDALSRRGHDVLHLYCAQFPSPKAIPGRPPGPARVEGLSQPGRFRKYDYLARRRLDIGHGRQVAQRIRAFAPEAVVSSTTPLDTQRIILAAARAVGARFVYWLQDVYSVGLAEVLWRVPAGSLVASHYRRLERRLLTTSDAVVAICPEFADLCVGWGLAPERCHVVPNWSPLADLVPRRCKGSWAADHGLSDKRIVLYAGTIGLKHDPALLLDLARRLTSRAETVLVVVSEGLGADRIATARPPNLRLLPFQPYDRMGDMLQDATVTLATLNARAGIFSVPSKIGSYMAAGRPIVISAPPENLASRTVTRAGAGLAVPAHDGVALVNAVERLLDDPVLAERCGAAGLAYAASAFEISAIADRFEAILSA